MPIKRGQQSGRKATFSANNSQQACSSSGGSFSGCGFCRRNKEPAPVFMSHELKDASGNVICPQLYKYRCELCGCTGSEAHTRSYCPQVMSLRRAVNNKQRGSSATSTSQGGDDDDEQNQEDRWANPNSRAIRLEGSRLFENMGKVTSSRYNSAGKLRNPRQGQQQHRQQQRQPTNNTFDNRLQPVSNPTRTSQPQWQQQALNLSMRAPQRLLLGDPTASCNQTDHQSQRTSPTMASNSGSNGSGAASAWKLGSKGPTFNG